MNIKTIKENIEKLINDYQETSDESIEKKLYNFKKKIANYVFNLDKKNNKLKANIIYYNAEISKNIQLMEDIKNPNNVEVEIENVLLQMEQIRKEISDKKQGKENYDFDLYKMVDLKETYSKLKKKLKRIQNKSTETIEKQNLENNEKLLELQNEQKFFSSEIENSLELIESIDKIFTSEESESLLDDSSKKSFIVKDLNVYYGHKHAIKDLNIEIPRNKVIAFIGPSGCGKSTFLRSLNRINDEIPSFRAEGQILLDGEYDIYKLRSIYNNNKKMEITELRTKVGMIFQQPNPFPMSIYKNVAFGPKINGIKNKTILSEIVENSLKDAALWDEVHDNLKNLGTSLSGGQQQRLCIARAIANKPEILLMDEPTSALDPIAASKIEDLILKLKNEYTIIIVTHSMQQAARISDYTAFMYNGELIEFDKTSKIFSNPTNKRTDDYIRGKFG